MGNDDSNLSDSMRPAINLEPAKYQWQRAAALALDISRSDSVFLHREAVRIAQSTLDRIGKLVEAAAKAEQEAK
jgi:hypothetical protein